MWHFDRKMFWIAMVSAAVCIGVDTMAGILVGGLISLFMFVDKMSAGESEIQLNKGKKLISQLDTSKFDKTGTFDEDTLKTIQIERPNENDGGIHDSLVSGGSDTIPEIEEFAGSILVYRITGQLTYINCNAHVHRIKQLVTPGIKAIIISIRYLTYMDLDGVDALKEMVEELDNHHVEVFLSGIKKMKPVLEGHKFYMEKVEQNRVFPSYLEALDQIAEIATKKEEPVEDQSNGNPAETSPQPATIPLEEAAEVDLDDKSLN